MSNHMDEHGEHCSSLIHYSLKLDEYAIPDYVGYPSSTDRPQQIISYCPWCGAKLPESKRDEWFDQLKGLGIDPWDDPIPEEFQSDKWRK